MIEEEILTHTNKTGCVNLVIIAIFHLELNAIDVEKQEEVEEIGTEETHDSDEMTEEVEMVTEETHDSDEMTEEVEMAKTEDSEGIILRIKVERETGTAKDAATTISHLEQNVTDVENRKLVEVLDLETVDLIITETEAKDLKEEPKIELIEDRTPVVNSAVRITVEILEEVEVQTTSEIEIDGDSRIK